MKVCLIQPGNLETNVHYFPLGLVYLGTLLKQKGHKVKIKDMRVLSDYDMRYSDNAHRLGDVLDYDVYGISVMTSQVKEAIKLSKEIKKWEKSPRIIWGGLHPTLYPEQTLNADYVDSIVLGEAESIIHKAVIRKDKMFFGEMLPFVKLPDPDYGLLDLKRYSLSFFGGGGVDVAVTRGCPFKCSFCLNHSKYFKKYRMMSVEQAKRIIKQTVELTNPKYVYFRDDYLFYDLDWTKKIVDYIHSLGLKWAGNTRVTDILRMSDEYLKDLKKKGCIFLALGIESGSNEMLKKIRKGITKDMAIKAVQRCTDVGIKTSGTFISGYPNESREQMKETAQLILDLYKINPNGVYSASVLRPYPGADIFKECVELGYKTPEDLEGWAKIDETFTIYHPPSVLSWIKDYDWFVRFFNYLQTIVYFKQKGYNTSWFEKRLLKNGWDAKIIYMAKKFRRKYILHNQNI